MDFECRHLGRLPMDWVLAKIIWDRDTFDFSRSDDDDDITLVDLSKEGRLHIVDFTTCDDDVRLSLKDVVPVTVSQETASSSNTGETNHNTTVQEADDDY